MSPILVEQSRRKRQTTADWVVDTLKKHIASGNYMVGDKLPTQMELAKMLNVGRSSIREAMRELQVLGLVELRTGSGATLLSTMITPESAVNWYKENALLLTDLFEVRFALEPASARLAAIRASKEDIDKLEEAFTLFVKAAAAVDVNQLVFQDEAFHSGIVRSSHNPFFLKISELLTQEFRRYRQRSFRISSNSFEAVDPHRDILNAISRRDPDSAFLHMTRHLELSLRGITAVTTSEYF
ncbi:MAG: FadR family transcriptional regulator [Planctomycetota bacterium]|jgi:DNA-binding FadR family transcriptional regulator|nr:FadR family transcriptional regulator [Planctomycetota bacterium]